MEFKTTHSLQFEVADRPYNIGLGVRYSMYRVGTCEGQWGNDKQNYFILSVINKQPGNGHLTDLLEWFEQSCKRDGKDLLVLECMNKKFKKHLIDKRGFSEIPGTDNVIKKFK